LKEKAISSSRSYEPHGRQQKGGPPEKVVKSKEKDHPNTNDVGNIILTGGKVPPLVISVEVRNTKGPKKK